MQNSTEINLANFNDGDVSQSFVYYQYIIIPSTYMIYTFDFIQQKQKQIVFQNSLKIQFVFKLQVKQFQNQSNQWWNIPYEYEDRYNTNDSQQLLIICVIAIENNIFKIFIAQLDTQEIKYSYSVQDSKITNAVNDPFRQLIFLVNNQGQTLVFNYSLKLIKIIQNSCLKQAKISFDSYFIYSICPNDIIIYNGLSFQQQYPKIQSGLKEVTNIVNIQYDNLFIITQKLNSLLVKLSFDSQYELIQIIDQEGLQLSKVELNKDSNNNIFLEMLFSSYRNIVYQIIPLSKKQSCNLEILQQNRPLENIYFQIELSNILNSLQNSQEKLSVLKINYLDQQYIQSIDLDSIQEKNIDPNKLLSLVIYSSSILNNIYWSKNQINSQNIRNVLINNMSLNIIDSVALNQNVQMKNFQMIDIILNVENSLNISNFDQVYLQNIKFNSKKLGNNQIIISNNKLVIIENITIDSIQTEQLTFYLSNNVNLVIKQIFINKLSKNNIFQIQNNQYIDIQDIQVSDAILISVFQISLCLKLNITNIYLKQVNSTQLLYLQGIAEIQVSQITVNSSNQVKILTIEPYYEKNVQYTCLSDVIQYISVLNSKEVSFDIQASNTSISDFYIYQSSISKTCFQVQSTNLVITNFKIEEVQPQIVGFQNCTLNSLTSLNNQITVLSINQQPDQGGYFIMSFSRLSSQEINEPLIELNFVDTILFNEVLIENNVLKENSYTSIIYVSSCNNITINNSQFQNNINFNGLGGSLYVFNCLNILIQNSIFKQNKCLRLNGGAISIQNFVNIAQVYIQKCQFILNSAAFSTGGAINLSYANLIIENSNVTSNTAIIGGGIYYEQVIPDFVLEKSNNIDKNKNQIINNNAKIFGHNIGSTIRQIDIDLQNIKIPKGSVKVLGKRQIEIREFKSGNQITFEGIQLLDEENNPIQISNINITEFQFYSSDIQSFVQSLSVSLNWDQSNKKIQVIGQVQSRQVINNGIDLQSQIMYMPQNRMSLQIVLDTLPKLIDSKGNIFFLQDQFQKNFTIDFTSCSIGEITTQQIESIICQECPEGKYSLDQYSTSCKQCPDSAKECYGSTIKLMNGYWRENNKTDIIVQCNKNPEFCQAESPDSKFLCLRGYIGPLCQQCDSYGIIWGNRYSQIFSSDVCYDCNESSFLIAFENSLIFLLIFLYIFIILIKIIQKMQAKIIGYFVNKSEILFLGSTLRQSDKPQIITKILTDHFQMLSLLNSFQINIPIFFKFPVLLYGNSLSITSKSFDCLISKYLILQPLWFYQTLFSLALPLLVLIFYILLALIFKLIKKDNFFLNYLRTALIFTYLYFFPMVVTLLSRSINCIQIGDKQYLDLDYNINCMDSKYHKPYIIYFSLPLLIIWILIIPIFLFRNVRNGIKQKWSIFKEVKYSFVFAGFKDKFYYWEFGKLFYKSLLISISILLQQNQQLKTSLMNGIILLWICIIFKLKPYIVKDFNNLLQQSAILSAISLNIISILESKLTDQLFQRTLFTLALFIVNLMFVLQLVQGLFIKIIPFDQKDRNVIHNILYYLKVKYPRFFKNIQIESKLKIQSLIKLKNVKRKINMLAQYFKNNDFYNQQSVQQHFGLSKALVDNSSSHRLQTSKFALQNFNQFFSKNTQRKLNEMSTLKKKWSFYTRTTNQSPLFKDRLQSTRNDKSQENILNSCQSEKCETINFKDEIDTNNF
ncbi:transmembrane protein, putative (macronuclear) [Tetrahymena thermophila SB210]|uniref:Transmembrane protein, putative n=1 Tax=Tetrahymena thermophila (strain SB210) TaxID=312017 RepID=Q22EJ4_TETTS|nr:transmembrane protein, putative [Tetrahymena thermophila SB210]EAR83658.2 transmembrane protein, putative [Tetrahymena thermophila SB210]|eukprot:XP_001031321.2 transmembrane protein, putative [Tetrahymena thermophila SB210]